MCFSASVSFTSAAFLAVNGVIGTYFASKGNKRFLPLNLMSFFYVIQQFSEGMIWMGSPVLTPTTWAMIFLFFAFFVYPWYQAFACFWLTRDAARRKKIVWVGAFAVVFALGLYGSALMTPDIGADQCRLHIFYHVLFMGKYGIEDTLLVYLLLPLYLFCTALPFFISDARYTSLLGWVIVLSSVICWFVYYDYFISVWCFYSAVLSVCIATYSYYECYRRRRKLAKQVGLR